MVSNCTSCGYLFALINNKCVSQCENYSLINFFMNVYYLYYVVYNQQCARCESPCKECEI